MQIRNTEKMTNINYCPSVAYIKTTKKGQLMKLHALIVVSKADFLTGLFPSHLLGWFF